MQTTTLLNHTEIKLLVAGLESIQAFTEYDELRIEKLKMYLEAKLPEEEKAS